MDLYSILGVEKTASQEEIKKAYRELSKIHHPDVNDNKNDDKFKDISLAYSVLSNEEFRKHYDETGEALSMSSKDDLENRAKMELIEIFLQSVRTIIDSNVNVITVNIVASVKETISKTIEAEKNKLNNIKNTKSKVKTILKRLKSKSKQTFLMEVLENQSNDIDTIICNINKKILTLEKMIEMLDDFSYEVEKGEIVDLNNYR